MSKLILHKAKLDLLTAEKEEQPKIKEKLSKLNNNLLFKALEDVSLCSSVIPEEERRVMEAIKKIESNKNEDKYWKTRIAYLEDNLNVIRKTYPIYEDEAKRRKDLIESVTRHSKWEEEKEKCKKNTLYWFNNYAWTSDPRKDGIGWALPFMLYEFQVDTLKWLEDLIFVQRSSGLIEKSRDMGLSWEISSLLYKHWQHGDGSFQALIGSMTIDDTDVVGNPSTIFEKIRIQSRMQPLGLLPKGFNGDIPYCKAINPETGATITGEPCNERFGRSGRYKVILFDELSAVPQDTEALTASSQSSPCKIYNSTVRGMGNEYARIRFSGSVPIKTLHWTLHPYKSNDWYAYQKVEMNSDTRVAQELDIDYSASQPNKVYTSWDETNHIITKSELMRALPNFFTEKGKFQIPLGHRIVMGQDVGQVHANVILWFVTLKQGTKTVDGIDLSGSVICYREMLLPPHTTPRLWAAKIKSAEGLYEPLMIFDRLISQEALTERDIYEEEYKLFFRHWTPNYNDGIPRVKDYLEIRYPHQPHPFREATRKAKFPNAPPIMGRPTIYFLVDDEQGELQYNDSVSRYYVNPAKDSNGLRRLRTEFPMYHYPNTELGKEIIKMRPFKALDDALDVLRCVATEHFAPIAPLNKLEKFEESLPTNLKLDNIQELPLDDRAMAWVMREQERKEFDRKESEVGLSFRDRVLSKLYHGNN